MSTVQILPTHKLQEVVDFNGNANYIPTAMNLILAML